MSKMSISREEILERTALAGDGYSEMEALARLLARRYSCRAYRPDPIPRKTIDRILAIAQMTASWCNAQPWQVIVTEGDGTERFRDAMFNHAIGNISVSQPDIPFPVQYAGAYGERRREAGWALYESLGIQKGDRAGSGRQLLDNYRLFGAPHVLFLTTETELGTYGILDCGIYIGNLLMLMQSLGIASIAQGAFAKFAPFIRDYFDIPKHRQILVGISFGYPDPDHPANGFRTRRAELDAVTKWVAA